MQAKDLFCQWVFQVFLNSPVQRTCAELRIVSFFCDEVLCLRRQFEREAKVSQTLHNTLHQDIDDLEDIILRECIEDDYIINTVQELRREGPLKGFFNNGFVILV